MTATVPTLSVKVLQRIHTDACEALRVFYEDTHGSAFSYAPESVRGNTDFKRRDLEQAVLSSALMLHRATR